MRISDWSSDVCSSDLHLLFPGAEPLISPCPSHLQVHHVTIGFNQAIAHFIHRAERQVGLLHRQDRKSVVSGKSVSVRVDLGGRRIIKKQIQTVYHLSYTNLSTIE